MRPDFNPGQLEAVESRSSRVVVSAGAGSGKTRVLVQRFVDRVLEQEAAGVRSPMRSVLLITFTDKAAGELTERVRRSFLDAGRADLARDVDSAWISTIHGFCARIVRRHAMELDVDAAFGVLADPQTGLERAAAFERAARACLEHADHRDEIAELIEEGVPDLRATVLSAYDRARSKGIAAADVAVAADPGYRFALHDLARTLEAELPAYRQLRETATVAANLQGFLEAQERLGAIETIGDEREGALAAFALAGLTGASRGDEEMRALTRSINDAIGAAVAASIDTLAAARARAWRELLVSFAEEYEAAKTAQGVLDFEDLQLLTRRLWSERPDIAEKVGAGFVEVMVDEFQDTNPLQLQVIGPISAGGQCVVGDVQQSIYRFRDADVGLLEEKRRSAEASGSQQACRLTVNYRSDSRLLDGLNAIFGTPEFFGDDYLVLEGGADRETGVHWPPAAPRIEAIVVDKALCSEEAWRSVEARALARRLREIVDAGQAAPDDIVLLVRASTTMPVYVEALRGEGLDVVAASAGGFYATPEYADVRALLGVLANTLDDESVLALLAGGLGGLSDDALLALAGHGRGARLWNALTEAGAGGLSAADAQRAALIVGAVDAVRERLGRLSLADAVLYLASVLGPGGGLFARGESWPNVRKSVRVISEFEASGGNDPASLLRYLDDRETFVPREPAGGLALDGAHAVRVMTVHAAKGLEFPVVAVADLGHGAVNRRPAFLLADSDGGLAAVARGAAGIAGAKAAPSRPWADAVEQEKLLDLAESRRVFYVACTRAEQALILAGSTDPEKAPREDIAIDWVLQAADQGGEELASLMAVAVIGPDDVGATGRGSTSVAAATARPVEAALTSEGGGPEAVGDAGLVTAALPDAAPIPAPREVSYTALALYERCGYRFFAERMLRVGSLKLAAAEDPLAFGSALHGALELVARGAVVDDAALRRLAAGHHLPGESLQRLSDAVSSVCASDEGLMLATGSPEVPFAIAVDGGVVRGTMDLVVRDGSRAVVLDYKTGRTWDATGARYAAQAEVYALALLVDGTEAVEVRFLHVEAGGETVQHAFTQSDRPRILARIEDAFRRMEQHEFSPLRAFDPALCADCPVSGGLCPVVHPHAGKRTP